MKPSGLLAAVQWKKEQKHDLARSLASSMPPHGSQASPTASKSPSFWSLELCVLESFTSQLYKCLSRDMNTTRLIRVCVCVCASVKVVKPWMSPCHPSGSVVWACKLKETDTGAERARKWNVSIWEMWELVGDLHSVCSPKHHYGLCVCVWR